MIRYPVKKAELEQLIIDKKADWLTRAAERTETFRTLGKYHESSTIWSEVKPVYMTLQGEGKCAYCERMLEAVELGTIEQDVEHFRPKGSVKAWAPKELVDLGIKFTPTVGGAGYHLLPYSIFNYAATCKPCNSTLKSDRFPVKGSYNLVGEDPSKMKKEKAYLIYPIGDIDDDPESLIEFFGPSPRAAAKSKAKRERALVTIAFFKLGDPVKRKNLFRDRAMIIIGLFPLLKRTTAGSAASRASALKKINGFLTPRLAHLNCAKSFKRLFDSDPAEAERVYDAAVDLIASIS